jgi:hypothetical protein
MSIVEYRLIALYFGNQAIIIVHGFNFIWLNINALLRKSGIRISGQISISIFGRLHGHQREKEKVKITSPRFHGYPGKGICLHGDCKALTDIYEANFKEVSKYVHATSRGHEAVQIALGMQLTPDDWLSAYYRDDSILLSIGMKPYDLMLQLMAKKDDPFSAEEPTILIPVYATQTNRKFRINLLLPGCRPIPTTGIAMGIQYLENRKLGQWKKHLSSCVPLVMLR